jgi:hypothetical protein
MPPAGRPRERKLTVRRISVPAYALHKVYADDGGYADGYVTEVAGTFSLVEFVAAFYTGSVFRIERFILTHALRKPSTDAEARELALGQRAGFAAWQQEGRTETQLVMCDYLGMTRSWFMVEPANGATRLYFGTAIAARRARRRKRIPFPFRATMWFHAIYSRMLLWSAGRSIRAGS